MPQMSPLLWTITIIITLSSLLLTSSFLYFYNVPKPTFLKSHHSNLINMYPFIWLW